MGDILWEVEGNYDTVAKAMDETEAFITNMKDLLSCMDFSQSSFCKHLFDAITINKARKPIYATLTQGRSRLLSNFLIWSEYLILPIAWYFDVWARKFNKQGIGIVSKDFVSVAGIQPAETAPKYKKQASMETLHELKTNLLKYKRECFMFLRNHDLQAVYKTSIQLLNLVNEKEKQEKVHFAMTQHFIESLAFATQNGLGYAKQSKGKTLRLSRKLIAAQFHAVDKGLLLDKMAHPLHVLGCGILVNDVPSIPLEKTF